jgi:hypothetical protein
MSGEHGKDGKDKNEDWFISEHESEFKNGTKINAGRSFTG